ncbi:MAG TPA: bifunctional rhamnulose-1-phosphate aldolase/short-chain dehydrogenase [Vicinamibacterales bacterium]|jgi:rhamnose utilization protein RhaD (predicted bifunctional aldolase and dehydrogenase)/NAD(P)-dependent dehydrogenase (short-subunit alcohol dehydrogenase family)
MTTPPLTRLKDLWDARTAESLAGTPLELLRYRSNLLGEDLRITNFGGGNTSSKFELPDPLTGAPTRVMAVKGSGGDLRSIAAGGFALLYMEKLEALAARYRGEAFEDEMVGLYPLCAFGENRVAASIDTALHAFLPFPHVDHLHPDWAIALAASANGAEKLEEFNRQFERRIAWVPWQRPGFELALMLRAAVADHPGCDGIVLGGHGLFTWGATQYECYLSSLRTIDQMGAFISQHETRAGRPRFGGAAVTAAVADVESATADLFPYLRGAVSSNRRVVGHADASAEAIEFANSTWAEALCGLGTSCPDHFLRTRISPMFVPWDPAKEDAAALRARIGERIVRYRDDYAAYYRAFAEPASPALRDSNPSVVVIPGLGLFGFGKDKREARITTEFFVNAIHVMQGANALEGSAVPAALPQVRRPDQAKEFRTLHNYVALPRLEAFRIEYWALEEAKLQRMPPEKEFSRKVVVVVGAGSGIGREVALQIARRGGHVFAADANGAAAAETAQQAAGLSSKEMADAAPLDLTSRATVAAAMRAAVLRFGGFDSVINTAAIFPTPPLGTPAEETWGAAMSINVTSNFVLAQEAATILRAQQLPASLVLTSSANAVVAKAGSEAYDVSKAAINHLVRELAVGLGPLVRVNAIAPATVVAGSAMFPRDRVMVSLRKYGIAFGDSESTDELRARLAEFYAQRTITKRPILPIDNANAICWLAGDQSAKTTGHVIPVDGGLAEAFLR